MQIRDVMVDCETLSTLPNAALLSIGAVKFEPVPKGEIRDAFYRVIRIDDQESLYGRNIDPDTVVWWVKQSDEAKREVFDNPKAVTLTQALVAFACWVNDRSQNVLVDRVWAYGASSDLIWLEDACRATPVRFPFTYRQHMCLRTLAALAGVPKPDFAAQQLTRHLTQHHALHDAIHQARWAQTCLAKLGQNESLDIPV